jgi:hypothetical protein
MSGAYRRADSAAKVVGEHDAGEEAIPAASLDGVGCGQDAAVY